MARRAFIGANRRTDGIRRKTGRAEVAQGARSRNTGYQSKIIALPQ